MPSQCPILLQFEVDDENGRRNILVTLIDSRAGAIASGWSSQSALPPGILASEPRSWDTLFWIRQWDQGVKIWTGSKTA